MFNFEDMSELKDRFYELETSLFKKEYLADKEYLNRIISEDFVEVGKSGKVYFKDETVDALYGSDDRNIKIKGLGVRNISSSVFLVTYISVHEDGTEVFRSSIWIQTLMGYVLKYHQATVLSM